MTANNEAAAESRKSGLNPIWLVAAAITVAAQWDQAFGMFRLLAEVFRNWLILWREVWQRFFDWLQPYVIRSFAPEYHDMLTLIATLLATLGIGQLILNAGKESTPPITTTDAVRRIIGGPTWLCALLANMLIAGALAIVMFPFLHALVGLWENASAYYDSVIANRTESSPAWQLLWLPAEVEKFYMTMGAFVPLFLIPFLWVFNIVVYHSLYSRSVLISLIGGIFLFGFFAMPIMYLFLPKLEGADWTSPAVALWYCLIAVLSVLAIRTALPIVQLALMIIALLAIDAGAGFAVDVWTTIDAGNA